MPKPPARIDDEIKVDKHGGGKIASSQATVTFEGKEVACAGDKVKHKDGTETTLKPGKSCVLVNGKPVALLGDETHADGKVNSAASTIQIDEGKPFVFIGPNVHIGKNVSFNVKKSDPDIEALRLAEPARKAALLLKEKFPNIKFTSGRRNLKDQARAMSENVVKNPKWIEHTYRKNKASTACQHWVDQHTINGKLRASRQEIEQGLLDTLNQLDDSEISQLSKHLSGKAFDIQPVPGESGEEIKEFIRSLPDLDKFLEKEGGLIRWHVQFL